MSEVRYVYLVTDNDAQGDWYPIVACESEAVAKEIADGFGGQVKRIVLVVGSDDES